MAAAGIDVADATRSVGPRVVGIGRDGRGSGFALDDGRVVTNAHNVHRGEATIVLQGGARARARALGVDRVADLAVLDLVEGSVDPEAQTAVEWAAEDVRLGTPVVALAAPGGLLRATAGAIAAVGARFRGPTGRPIGGALEHTAPLAPGSSGGPLVDAGGGLVGISTNRLGGGLYQAIAATPELRERLDELARGEVREPRRLGVALAPPHAAQRLRAAVGLPQLDGVLVLEVEEDGPAARAGLARGDLVVRAGDRPVHTAADLLEAVDGAPEGLTLTVVRGVDERGVTIAWS